MTCDYCFCLPCQCGAVQAGNYPVDIWLPTPVYRDLLVMLGAQERLLVRREESYHPSIYWRHKFYRFRCIP